MVVVGAPFPSVLLERFRELHLKNDQLMTNPTLAFVAWAIRHARSLPAAHQRAYYVHLVKSEVRSYSDLRDREAIEQLLEKGRSHVQFIVNKYKS